MKTLQNFSPYNGRFKVQKVLSSKYLGFNVKIRNVSRPFKIFTYTFYLVIFSRQGNEIKYDVRPFYTVEFININFNCLLAGKNIVGCVYVGYYHNPHY